MSLIEYGYKNFVRSRIFQASKDDAEIAHEWGIKKLVQMQNSLPRLWLARWALCYKHPILETKVFGIQFRNPFGLAAGFDKYCEVSHKAIPACGWGFAEVGGITRYQQDGNDRPRMARSEELLSLWNFMGFNNPGSDHAARILLFKPRPIPIGVNVGKSKVTPLPEAAEDYCYTIAKVWSAVDFITLNPSSPNTPGLRNLQSKKNLLELVRAAQKTNGEKANEYMVNPKPLGIKISPDESDEQLQDIADVCFETEVDYVIATNTTVDRSKTKGWAIPGDRGGVSGQALKSKSIRMQKQLYRQFQGRIPIIGVGGIASGADLFDRILSGASLCQAYTAWPFEGPDFVKRCLKDLVLRLKAHGFRRINEAVGAGL